MNYMAVSRFRERWPSLITRPPTAALERWVWVGRTREALYRDTTVVHREMMKLAWGTSCR